MMKELIHFARKADGLAAKSERGGALELVVLIAQEKVAQERIVQQRL